MSSKTTARTDLRLARQSHRRTPKALIRSPPVSYPRPSGSDLCRGHPARSIRVQILPLFFFRRLGEKRLTTIFQIKTFTAIRLFEQAFHFLRSRDQIVHFGYLALRE